MHECVYTCGGQRKTLRTFLYCALLYFLSEGKPVISDRLASKAWISSPPCNAGATDTPVPPFCTGSDVNSASPALHQLLVLTELP